MADTTLNERDTDQLSMNIRTVKSASGGDEVVYRFDNPQTHILAVYGSYDGGESGTLTIEENGVVVFDIDVTGFFVLPFQYITRVATTIKLSASGTAIGKLNIQVQ